MEPFKVNITGVDGKDWGEFKVTQMTWENEQLMMIKVDFGGGMYMRKNLHHLNNNIFYNNHENLSATIVD